MSHNIYWDADQSDVLHIDLNGVTTWDAYHEIINAAFERVEATQQSVYAILHDRGTKPPEGPLPHFRKTIARAYATPNLMLAVSVDSHFPAFFARMVKVVLDIYFLNRPNKVPYVTQKPKPTRSLPRTASSGHAHHNKSKRPAAQRLRVIQHRL